MIKGAGGTVHFFVINTATGLGVAGLTVAGNSFTSIKLAQNGALSADIKGTITLVDLLGGFYSFAISAGESDYASILPVIIPATATYQAYGICAYTETAARAGNAMDLIDALKHISGSSGYDRTTDSMEAVGSAAASVKATTDKVETVVEAVP